MPWIQYTKVKTKLAQLDSLFLQEASAKDSSPSPLTPEYNSIAIPARSTNLIPNNNKPKTNIEIHRPKLSNRKSKVNIHNIILTEIIERPKDNRNNATPGAVKSVPTDSAHPKDNQMDRKLNSIKQTNKQRKSQKTYRKIPPPPSKRQ